MSSIPDIWKMQADAYRARWTPEDEARADAKRAEQQARDAKWEAEHPAPPEPEEDEEDGEEGEE